MSGDQARRQENERVVKSFAIIGTRRPDSAQSEAATVLANVLTWLGNHFIHTGGAYGIDQKAMDGSNGKNLKVFLPWDSYNGDIIPKWAIRMVYDPTVHANWTNSVNNLHPHALNLSRGAFALHARNYGIIEGVNAVIAFPREDGSGGTSQGIRVANYLKIPVIQANKGSIIDVPRFAGKVLQELGLASKHLSVTLPGGRNV